MYIKNNTLVTKLSVFMAIILWPLNASVFADEVNIVVKERGTGVVVEGAYVIINNEQFVESSNVKGQVFFNDINVNDKIKIVAPGFQDLLTEYRTSSSLLKLYLYPEVVQGVGFEVTEARIKEKVSKISLTTDELTNAPGSQGDPLKVITSLPGIVESSEASSKVYMRGSDDNDNSVWVNNAPVGYLYHFGGFHSTINPALIDDLNIFLGGFPVEYGDKLGGVIDVKLRAPRNDRQRYKFDISTISASMVAEGPVGQDDSYYVAYRRSYIDLLLSPAKLNQQLSNNDPDADLITTVPRYFDSQMLYRHKLEKGYIDSYIFAAADKLAVDIVGSAKSDPELAGETFSSQEFQTIGSTLVKPWNATTDFVMPLALYHSKNTFRLGRDPFGDPYFVNFEVNTLFWQPELEARLNKTDSISYGYSVSISQIPVDLNISRPPSERDIDFNLTDLKKYRLKTDVYLSSSAPYVKYRKKWSNSITTITGLRYSDIQVRRGLRETEFSPRATIEYQYNPDTLFTATWGKYIQLPQGAEIVDGFGNPNLKVTKAEHRILGVQYKISPKYSIKTEIYDKPLTDLVVSVDANEPPNNYSNEGKGRAYGIDIFIKRKAENRRLAWLSFSASKSIRTDLRTGVTRDFSGDTPLSITGVWGQPFTGSWSKWDWSIKAKLTSGTPYTPVIARNRLIPGDSNSRWVAQYAEFNSVRTPNYFKMDLRLGRTVLFKESKLKYYFDLQNVTFSKNITSYDYGNEFEKIDNPDKNIGIGFFPFFGVEIDF